MTKEAEAVAVVGECVGPGAVFPYDVWIGDYRIWGFKSLGDAESLCLVLNSAVPPLLTKAREEGCRRGIEAAAKHIESLEGYYSAWKEQQVQKIRSLPPSAIVVEKGKETV